MARVIFTSEDYKLGRHPEPMAWEEQESCATDLTWVSSLSVQPERLCLTVCSVGTVLSSCLVPATDICPLPMITMVSAAKRPKLWDPCVKVSYTFMVCCWWHDFVYNTVFVQTEKERFVDASQKSYNMWNKWKCSILPVETHAESHLHFNHKLKDAFLGQFQDIKQKIKFHHSNSGQR